jgi:hypothetical protein
MRGRLVRLESIPKHPTLPGYVERTGRFDKLPTPGERFVIMRSITDWLRTSVVQGTQQLDDGVMRFRTEFSLYELHVQREED